MSKMKNIGSLKYIVLGMLISSVMFVTGTYADSIISASRIEYSDNSSLGAQNVQDAIDKTCIKFSNQLTDLKKDVINEMYPEGSIYITTSISDPKVVASTLGVGEWEAYGTGRTLVGVDINSKDELLNTVEQVGGKNKIALTTANLPSHTHKVTAKGNVSSSTSGTYINGKASNGYTISYSVASNETSQNGEHTHNYTGPSGVYMTGGSSSGEWSRNLVGSARASSSAGAHTHTVSDKYASSISGVAAHSHNVESTFTGTEVETTATGNGRSIDITNPYITVYMYKRTA